MDWPLILWSAWWSALLAIALVVVGGWLWDRRPWRPREITTQEYQDARWRDHEGRKLAELEAEVQAEGMDVWRPDPERVKELSKAAQPL